MATNNPLTTALTARLRHAFSSVQIADLADSLTQIQALGLKIDDVFPQGIPVQDVLVMKTLVPIKDIGSIIAQLHQQVPVRRIDISPFGIPTQDMWRMRIGVGLK